MPFASPYSLIFHYLYPHLLTFTTLISHSFRSLLLIIRAFNFPFIPSCLTSRCFSNLEVSRKIEMFYGKNGREMIEVLS